MVLVDTSVLIDFFKGKSTPQTQKFEDLERYQIPYGICDLIYQEILQGARSDKEFKQLVSYLSTLPFFQLSSIESIEHSSSRFRKLREKGITIRSTVDHLIAQIAIDNDLRLLHDDQDFYQISKIDDRLISY